MIMEPKIRLKGFSGEWENTSLGQAAFDFKYGINAAAKEYDGHNKYLRITDIDDSSREFCYEDLTSPNTDLTNCNDYLMKVGDIVVARTGASVGKTYKYREKDGTVYFAGFLIRFTANNDYDSDFVFYNTLTKGYDKHIKLVSQRSGQPGVNVSELQSFAFNAPSLPEQRALATFFTSLNNQISAAEKRLASLKQVKAASLQAMFPQEGETTPKLRFKGCEGEWKKVKLGEVFEHIKNNSLSRDNLATEGLVMNVHYGDILIKFGAYIDTSHDDIPFIKDDNLANTMLRMGKLQCGDVIIADAAEDNTVGKCSELIVNNANIVSGLHTIVIRPKLKFASCYLGYYMNSPSYHNQLLPHIQGSKISSISKKAVDSTYINYPSLSEQRQIASYFTSLDRQISAQSSKISKLKQIKSACLDQMFV